MGSPRLQIAAACAAIGATALIGALAGWPACGVLWAVVLLASAVRRIPFLLSARPAVQLPIVLYVVSYALWLASDAWRILGGPWPTARAAVGPELIADLGMALFVIVIVWTVHLRGRPRVETWMDALIFVAALAPALWLGLIQPAEGSPAMPWLLLWSVLTMVLLFAGALFVLSGGCWNGPSVMLALGVVGNIAVATALRVHDPASAGAAPQYLFGYMAGVYVALHPGLPAVFERGGRPAGIPLDTRVWMLVLSLLPPITALGWSYVAGDPSPILAIAGSVATIALLVAIRAVLLMRAGIENWSVPLTISFTALLVSTMAISMSSLSQSAQRAQRAADRASAALPQVRELDGLLLRSAGTSAAARAAYAQWTQRVRVLRRGDLDLGPALDRYVTAAITARVATLTQATGLQADPSVASAQRALATRAEAELASRQQAARARNRNVRLFSVSMLMLTLIAVAGLLLRFNAARRRIDRLHQATHDDLTGLPNRVALDRELQRPGPPTAADHQRTLIMLDLDGFKAINDSLGHAAGDAVIRTVAQRLEETLRSDHMLVRLDGDAFAVVVPAGAEALDTAHRIHGVLATPIRLSDGPHTLTGSIGLTVIDEDDAATRASAFRDAELAMYQAKLVAGNTLEWFSNDIDARVRGRLQLAADLRAALDGDGGLHLAYQPIVDLTNGRVSGYEALIRWNHPVRGPLSPAEFIPLAEETGLVVDLGGWVLRSATAQCAAWQREWTDERYVSVNVAAGQFTSGALTGQVQTALAQSGLAPHHLLLEVTESSVIADVDENVAQMHRIRELGVRFALDDFGTGYSSLSYLRRFPVDVVKVDKAFIDALDDSDGFLLVQAIVRMVTSLRLHVVAEGIEHLDQATALQDLGCQLGQGFHFSRPVAPLEVQAGPGSFTVPASRMRALP